MIQKNKEFIDKYSDYMAFIVVFALIFFRYCYFGFEYYWQLDDYLQLNNFRHLWGLEFTRDAAGYFSSRPLAGLTDFFLWSRFNENLIIVVAAMSAMLAAAGMLFQKVFNKHFGTGYVFLVFFALLPIGIEGVYWLAAATRVVYGMFWAALSLYFFDRWCSGGKKYTLILYILFQLMSYCCYEQYVFLSGAATFVIMALHFNRRQRNKRALWGFSMFPLVAVYWLLSSIAPAGHFKGRVGLFLPWQEGYWSTSGHALAVQIMTLIKNAVIDLNVNGLRRSLEIITYRPNIPWLILIIGLCCGLFFIVRSKKQASGEKRWAKGLLAGVFLCLAPMLLFFIIANPWYGARNLVVSICGIALFCDTLLRMILSRIKHSRQWQAAFAGVFALFCCVVAVSEMYDYKSIYEDDQRISRNIYTTVFEEHGSARANEVIVLNIDDSYLKDKNFRFHEHGGGATGSDWALSEAVRAVSMDVDVPNINPVSVYAPAFLGDPERAVAQRHTFIYDYETEGIQMVWADEEAPSRWVFYNDRAEPVALLTEDDGEYSLKMDYPASPAVQPRD